MNASPNISSSETGVSTPPSKTELSGDMKRLVVENAAEQKALSPKKDSSGNTLNPAETAKAVELAERTPPVTDAPNPLEAFVDRTQQVSTEPVGFEQQNDAKPQPQPADGGEQPQIEPPKISAAGSEEPNDGNSGEQPNAGEPQVSETAGSPGGEPPEATQAINPETIEQPTFTPPPSETVETNVEPVEDVQAFIQNDERLQKLLSPENSGDLVVRDAQNNVDVQKTINNIGNNLDKATPAQRKLYYGLQEAQELTTAAEGQREVDALKASGEDLTTPENRAKVAEAQKKIQDGQGAERTRAMRQKITQSPELQDILRKNGIDPDITDISEIDAALAEVKSRKAKGQNLTSAQKDLLKKFDSLSGQTLKDVADKQLANATTPEEINAAVIKLAHAHESDKGQFTVWAEGVGSFLSQFSGEKLKQTRKDFVNYGRTLKQLKHELKEAKTDKDKERIQKSIDNASNLRIQALKEYVGKNILKWGVLLLVLGPIILSILTGLAAPKLLQFLGKAGGGQ